MHEPFPSWTNVIERLWQLSLIGFCSSLTFSVGLLTWFQAMQEIIISFVGYFSDLMQCNITGGSSNNVEGYFDIFWPNPPPPVYFLCWFQAFLENTMGLFDMVFNQSQNFFFF